MKTGVKRENSNNSNLPVAKRKKNETNTGSKQASLKNFFSLPKADGTKNNSNSTEISVNKNTEKSSKGEITQTSTITLTKLEVVTNTGTLKEKTSSAQAWKQLLKGPPTAPLCKGHNEPCLLRTVKKDGPNKGKQFFVCNRPEGHSSNPQARCDYFVWVDKMKSDNKSKK